MNSSFGGSFFFLMRYEVKGCGRMIRVMNESKERTKRGEKRTDG